MGLIPYPHKNKKVEIWKVKIVFYPILKFFFTKGCGRAIFFHMTRNKLIFTVLSKYSPPIDIRLSIIADFLKPNSNWRHKIKCYSHKKPQNGRLNFGLLSIEEIKLLLRIISCIKENIFADRI